MIAAFILFLNGVIHLVYLIRNIEHGKLRVGTTNRLKILIEGACSVGLPKTLNEFDIVHDKILRDFGGADGSWFLLLWL